MPASSRSHALVRGAAGALALGIGLGMAVAAGEIGERRLGVDGMPRRALQALVCSALTVPLIVLLRRRVDRRPMRGLGLPGFRDGLQTFGLGVAVTAAAAAAAFGSGAALGWVQVSLVSASAVAAFLAVDLAIAFLFEALPEELALRGYCYRSLNAGLRRWVASLLTIGLFLAVPALASVVTTVVTALLAGSATPIGFAPGGMDPVSYLVLLTVFGTALLAARITTGSLWASIGLHLTFLAVNRFALGGARLTGVSATFATPDAILLIPAYVLLAAGAFLGLARLRGRRLGCRDRDPE